ncbi:hypothetical protein ASPTUDRAFT_196156 [Aspergillus tubingensis CBS 134.48]|uniref:Uncharacterized protein n=1 Tax=Aspergillus tubingensis (strain CBS 134.48) TaxID=767770 RepID=A0A1L9NH46_ASPTC|nr:hypothetical protein ASPTUDRAFT_196156 [Aspergillus tubingensis CBS 134.48]
MPQLASCISTSTWHKSGPQTPAQQHFIKYVDTVDTYGSSHGSGLRFYSRNVIFHNQNTAQYNGGNEMWAWMKRLFGQSKGLRHDFHNLWETRNIWPPGNDTEEPTVAIPLSWISTIGPANSADALDGLQFKEVWLYWDTAILAKYLPRKAVVFQEQNILHQK